MKQRFCLIPSLVFIIRMMSLRMRLLCVLALALALYDHAWAEEDPEAHLSGADLHKEWDVNGDGLSLEELLAGVRNDLPPEDQDEELKKMPEFFTRADNDSDGKLSVEELEKLEEMWMKDDDERDEGKKDS